MPRTINEELEAVALDAVKPHPQNPRRGDVDAIKESILANGFYGAVVVQRSTGFILAGNHRYEAAREAGMTELPAIFVDVDDDAALRILLADNRTNDLAAYDDKLLADLLGDMDDLTGTGYDREALDALLADLQKEADGEGKTDPDAVPDVPKKPITKPGDLYLLGEHRLLCGDSTKAEDVARLMDGAKADMVFTDPPYGVGYDGGAKKREKLAGDEVGTAIYGAALPHLRTAAADHAALYLWYADAHAAAAAAAAAGYVITAQVIWIKNNAQFMSSAHYHGKHEPCFYAHRKGKTAKWCGSNNEVTVWEVDRAPRNEYHPTQKPVELAERAMRNSSAHGALVLDLFGGSGSTMIASEQTGRRAYLMEIDPRYCDVIVKRWEDFTGNKAVLADPIA